MRKFLTSLVVAGAMLVATASTALMATPTVGASCDADNSLVTVSFIYDASQTPPPISDVQVVNSDTTAQRVEVNFYSLSTGSLFWSGSATFTPGTTDLNVTALHENMVSFVGKFGTGWVFPVVVSCASK